MVTFWSETCWSNYKYFITILIVSTNYTFVHLLDNKLFYSSLIHGTNMNISFDEYYFYWTEHRLDSWIKRDQLDVISDISWSIFIQSHLIFASKTRLFLSEVLTELLSIIQIMAELKKKCLFRLSFVSVLALMWGTRVQTDTKQQNLHFCRFHCLCFQIAGEKRIDSELKYSNHWCP